MKHRIAAALALAATTLAPFAKAATYVYTFGDMSEVPNQARNTFNTARYWEKRGPLPPLSPILSPRWGTVWTSPLTFATSYPTSAGSSHFHIGFKGQYECFVSGTYGRFVNNVCTPHDPWINRGPFSTHVSSDALYFQLVKTDRTTMVPFVAKSIDVYNTSNEMITLFVRKQTDGGWFYWTNLHGSGNGEPSYFRWFLSSGYSGKFTAMAWMSITGAAYSSNVGRVEVTD